MHLFFLKTTKSRFTIFGNFDKFVDFEESLRRLKKPPPVTPPSFIQLVAFNFIFRDESPTMQRGFYLGRWLETPPLM
jgi:hypothetical protein